MFIHVSADEHLGCYYLLAIVTSAAVNMYKCLKTCFQFFWVYV